MKATKRIVLKGLLLVLMVFVMFASAGYAFGQKEIEKPASPVQVKVQVILKSVDLIYNNHVGNEWTTYTKVNDVPISRYQEFERVYDTPEVTLELYASAREYDKYPDVGLNYRVVTVGLKNGHKHTEFIALYVRVVEDKGKYAGNYALWRFGYEITIKPDEPDEEKKF